MPEWKIDSVIGQKEFFRNWVEPYSKRDNRIFVIISDAFRYESAVELREMILQKNTYTAELQAALGSLPSYTQLGMASLLPHKNLTFNEKSDIVFVDGQSTQGTPNRTKILQKYAPESIAIVAEYFLKMKAKTEGREFIKPYNIIYIYSNHIDKTGDDKTSECDVFKATKDEFDYLMKIIKQIAGMNGTNMLITSDHGYLYQQNRLDETDFTDFTLQAKYIKPAIADKIFPRQLRAAFYTTSGKLISDSASFIFNSNDKDAAAREQRKTFLFISDASKYNGQEVILKNVPVYVLEYLLGMYCSTDGIDVTCRSVGMEPVNLDENTKWHLVARIIPFVEKNYNIYELGPRGTEKSYVYDEISPYSILISGGQTTVANLFYNMSSRTVGLVGLWDVVAFDEVAGINMKDKDGTQIMKGFMANGSFSRGKESINADASMVFVGNINGSIENLVKTSHLLSPFPKEMIDTAFLIGSITICQAGKYPKCVLNFLPIRTASFPITMLNVCAN